MWKISKNKNVVSYKENRGKQYKFDFFKMSKINFVIIRLMDWNNILIH